MADLLFYLFEISCFALLNEQQVYFFDPIRTSQKGGQLYSDTTPYSSLVSTVATIRVLVVVIKWKSSNLLSSQAVVL